MKRLFIKQQVFSFRDRFYVKDETGADVYYVEGEVLSLGKKLRVYDKSDQEVLYIEQKLWRFLPEFDLYAHGNSVATVKKDFTFFKNNYQILGQNWSIDWSVMAHEYVIRDSGNRVIADISKKWLSWGDSYEIVIYNDEQVDILLGIVIAIDCVISQSRASNSSG